MGIYYMKVRLALYRVLSLTTLILQYVLLPKLSLVQCWIFTTVPSCYVLFLGVYEAS